MKIQPPKHPQIINGGRLRKHHLFLKENGISSWRLKEDWGKKNSVNCLAPSTEHRMTWLLYPSHGASVLITLSIGWTRIKEKEKAIAKLWSTFQAWRLELTLQKVHSVIKNKPEAVSPGCWGKGQTFSWCKKKIIGMENKMYFWEEIRTLY